MIHRDERQVPRRCDRLARHHADHHPADQSGAAGGRHARQVRKANLCVFKRAFYKSVEVAQMRARGDLRHHAAEGTVLLDLAQDQIREDQPVAAHDGDAGFIAAGFNAKDDHDSPFIAGGTAVEKSKILFGDIVPAPGDLAVRKPVCHLVKRCGVVERLPGVAAQRQGGKMKRRSVGQEA